MTFSSKSVNEWLLWLVLYSSCVVQIARNWVVWGGKERGKKTQEVRFLKSIMVEIKDVSLH